MSHFKPYGILEDAEARQYEVDLMGLTAAGGASLDGELSPGERVRGKVAYQIPEGAIQMDITFHYPPELFELLVNHSFA